MSVSVFFFDDAGGLAPSRCLPIVLFAFGQRNPGRERLKQVRTERENIRFIHLAQFAEACVGLGTVMKFQAVFCKCVSDAAKFCRRQAVLRKCPWRRAENLRKIDNGVTSDGKGQFSLTLASAFDADHYESASIENCRERGDPRLIIVL